MKYLFLLLSVLLIGCNAPEAEFKKEFNTDHYKTHNIDFLKGRIYLPYNYEPKTIDELEEIFQQSNDPQLQKTSKGYIRILRNTPNKSMMFVDKKNILNSVSIMAEEYVKLDKQLASEYIGLLEQQFQKRSQQMGYEYERLEGKFLQTAHSKIIKVKYKYIYNGMNDYQTQYIITSKFKTFGVTVNYKNLDIDLEEVVKRIALP